MSNSNNKTITAIKAMLGIVAITVAAEVLISLIFMALGQTVKPWRGLALETFLLAVVIAPPIYWLVFNPIRRESNKRVAAERVAEDMGRLAITDPLTRLSNRRGITTSLLDAMAQAERYGHPLSVAMADIDLFKAVNDTYGHEAGDKVLVDVAAVLADALRMPDKVGRYGGEEFLVVLPHTELAQAAKIAERMRAAVASSTTEFDSKKTQVTISIGLAQYKKGEDLEQFLSRVDQALYRAKAGGRNMVVT